MGKKVKEYKTGDFIFAKVKGYPAWPARVQGITGKKYFIYFYGTGEIANLPATMMFDYAENKDKFLNKSIKRKDFNDGVRQIEYDFTNNVPLEETVPALDRQVETLNNTDANDTANDTVNDTADDTLADTTAADTTAADTTAADDTANDTLNTTSQSDPPVEDSDEGGLLVIDEGKKGRIKSKVDAVKTPAKEKESPKPSKEAKTPRGRAAAAKKEEEDAVKDKKEEEVISRSGRKIRPKRYIDEHTEDNAVPPSPAPKRRRGGSPASDKSKTDSTPAAEKAPEKQTKQYNTVRQSEIEDLQKPFTSDGDKDSLLIAYLSNKKQYVGVKLFQNRPTGFKSEAARLNWDKQAAKNAIRLKNELETGYIKPQSVLAQLETELNLTDEDKYNLDNEREIEKKKAHMEYLRTEIKLMDLNVQIKTCLTLDKGDTDVCLKVLDQLLGLDVTSLMLLKHPNCVESIKRMRCYVGNSESWGLNDDQTNEFEKKAHLVRKRADLIYNKFKNLFSTPDGLSFWEFFSQKECQFRKCTAKLKTQELLELVTEPIGMYEPSCHTMTTAIEAVNNDEVKEAKVEGEDGKKKKTTPVKKQKSGDSSSPKQSLKRQLSQKSDEGESKKDKERSVEAKEQDKDTAKTNEDVDMKDDEQPSKDDEVPSDNEESSEKADETATGDGETIVADAKADDAEKPAKESDSKKPDTKEVIKENSKTNSKEETKEKDKNSKEEAKEKDKNSKEDKKDKDKNNKDEKRDKDKTGKEEKREKDKNSKEEKKDKDKNSKDETKQKDKNSKEETKDKDNGKAEKMEVDESVKAENKSEQKKGEDNKEVTGEPKPKRARESREAGKKTEQPLKPPTKRKSKS